MLWFNLVVAVAALLISGFLFFRFLKKKLLTKVYFIVDDEELYPFKKYYDDAGWDLKAAEDVVIRPGEYKMIATGVKTVIPVGFYGHIRPRSGLAAKHGIMTMAGVIDSGYRNEIKVLLYNAGKESFKVERGDRIAQLVFTKILLNADVIPSECAKKKGLLEAERALNGFGSTGVK